MSKTRNLSWQLPLLFALTLPLWWEMAGRFLNPTTLREFGNDAPLSTQVLAMEGVTFLQARAGVNEWRLAAAKIDDRKGQRLFAFTEPRLELLGREAGGENRVSSRQAVYDTENQLIAFSEQVQLRTGEGYELTAPELQYRLLEKKLRSESKVIFTGSNLRITGGSFQYDLKSGNFKVGKQVACELW